MELTVSEAAGRLGLNQSRVRALLDAGQLRGRRVGNLWLVDSAAVERRRELISTGGRSRPMAARVAWAAAALVDGGGATWLNAGEQRRLVQRLVHAHRARAAWGLFARWLQARHTRIDRYRIADSDIADLLASDGVVASGVSAAVAYDLGLGTSGQAEAYVDQATAARLVRDWFLVDDRDGNLLLHTVAGDWHRRTAVRRGDRLVAARLVVALDLVEVGDSRSRSAGQRLLKAALSEFARTSSRVGAARARKVPKSKAGRVTANRVSRTTAR